MGVSDPMEELIGEFGEAQNPEDNVVVIGTIAMSDYLEAGTIVFLFTIAEWLESRAGHKAKAVMSSLMSMAPQKAVLADTGDIVDVDEVKLSTIIAVKAGEVIPIDGIVVDGKSEVDEKTLTGESYPVTKEKDSTVWAGTVNLNGYISVKTTALAEDCVVAKMAKLVEEAQNSKTRTQRFIDKCTKYYTPAVLLISVSVAVIPAALRVHDWNKWFHLSLVVLLEQALDIVHAELLPEDKAKIIKEFKMEGHTGMVGDGINDAPALATADIGISMGISGSALAQETGDIILMSNDIRKLPKAIQLARRANRKVIENVILSITTKAAILALGIAGHPLVWAAVLADVGTCVLVILNSMILLRGTERHVQKHVHNHGKHVHNHGKHKHSHSKRNQQCCSDRKVAEVCESQKCSSQSCESDCRPSLNLSIPGNHKCCGDLHEAKHHDHGRFISHNHESNRQSHTHTNQRCCPESKSVIVCEPPKCCSR